MACRPTLHACITDSGEKERERAVGVARRNRWRRVQRSGGHPSRKMESGVRKGKGRVKLVTAAAAWTPGRRPDADGWAWPRPSAHRHRAIRGRLREERRCSSISRMRSPPGFRLRTAAASTAAAAAALFVAPRLNNRCQGGRPAGGSMKETT